MYLLAYRSVFNVFSHDAMPGEMVAIWRKGGRAATTKDAGKLHNCIMFVYIMHTYTHSHTMK